MTDPQSEPPADAASAPGNKQLDMRSSWRGNGHDRVLRKTAQHSGVASKAMVSAGSKLRTNS